LSLTAQHLQANRLDLLSRLAGDISHEIKNPLHAMVINLELVRRKVERGEPAAAIERVEIIEDEIRKVHALANALLEALRPPRDAQQASSFSAVVEEMLPLVAARARLARVGLEVHSPQASVLVPLPPQELRLLLLNLADRAVRIVGAGSAIDLHATADAGGARLEIRSGEPLLDETERAWLRDAPADSDHIDLGLRTMRHLAEHAGGRLESAAATDSRASLAVSLPRAGAA
jgi:C4-dicarboxylate-specific signal transduction histidine kinase